MKKLYGIRRPDGTIVQDNGDGYGLANCMKYDAADAFRWSGAEGKFLSFVGDRLKALRRHGYSVVEVEIVEKKK